MSSYIDELNHIFAFPLRENSSDDDDYDDDDDDYDDDDDDDRYYDKNEDEYENDPDTWYEEGSITVVYTQNGKLYTDEWPTTHENMINDDPALSTEMGITEPEDWVSRKDAVAIALLGRISDDRKHIAFWNYDEGQYNDLLAGALKPLYDQLLIGPDTIVHSPIAGDQTVRDILTNTGNRVVHQAPENYMELLKKLHLMPGPEKNAALRKLGAIKPNITPWQKEKRELYKQEKDSNLLYPAWRATSEETQQ
jgi:hypothetical protein